MSENEIETEEEVYATLVEINKEPTELYKILKFENIVSGGGEAKQVISEGYVYLNGEVETRKRKKVYSGDLIYFNEQYLQVVLKGSNLDNDIVETFVDHVPLTDSSQTKSKKARKLLSF